MQAEYSGETQQEKQGVARLMATASGILAPLSFLLMLCVLLALRSPHFATKENFKQIAIQAAVIAILSCGQTAVIISGNIDLSVGSVMAFSGVAAALAMTIWHCSIPVAVLIACVSGLGMGTITGLITAYGKIPAFIATLGMMGIVQGCAGILSHSVSIGGLPPAFRALGTGELFGDADRDGIPYAVLTMAGAALLVHILLSRTTWGRGQYAMGGNREAARLSGLSVRRSVISVFALSGLLAGIASLVNVAYASVATKDAGVGYELYAVAAAVVGGTSLFGGQGGIPGTIIGAFLIFTIRNGCDLLDYGPDPQRVIIGVVVILAVLYDRFGPGRKKAGRK